MVQAVVSNYVSAFDVGIGASGGDSKSCKNVTSLISSAFKTPPVFEASLNVSSISCIDCSHVLC